MRRATVTFSCDTTRCKDQFVAETFDGDVGVYLQLVAAGWEVRRLTAPWKHYCPTHGGEKP